MAWEWYCGDARSAIDAFDEAEARIGLNASIARRTPENDGWLVSNYEYRLVIPDSTVPAILETGGALADLLAAS